MGASSRGEQLPSRTAVAFRDQPHVDGAEQPSQLGLPTAGISPCLGDNHRVRAQIEPCLSGCVQPGNGSPLASVDHDQGASIEDHSTHAAASPALMPSSLSALAISSAVRSPCSACHSARNSVRACSLSLRRAAPASQAETAIPDLDAAAPTASPSSGAKEMLSLSTFTVPSYRSRKSP